MFDNNGNNQQIDRQNLFSKMQQIRNLLVRDKSVLNYIFQDLIYHVPRELYTHKCVSVCVCVCIYVVYMYETLLSNFLRVSFFRKYDDTKFNICIFFK